jgi:tetratricopeptide (TPR) repeat protein
VSQPGPGAYVDEQSRRLGSDLLPDRYSVRSRIATGGMASVWAAEDQLLRRLVAVKVLAEHLAGDERAVLRFAREARTAAGLSGHPNVLTIFDVGEHEGRPFIVMEYLSGGTVGDRLRAGRAALPQALSWIHQAASALDHAHERGIVHRDVKPQNLLFDQRGRLVIGDFGIARAAYEQTVTASGELIGTAAYISPEQAAGDPGTAASDRYSLAVVAYELLTGSRPFDGSDFAEQARRHMQAEPPAPSSVEPELAPSEDSVLLRGLAKDPADRWPSASAFADALAAATQDREGPALIASPQGQAADPGPRHRATDPHGLRPARSLGRRALPFGLVVLGAAICGVIIAFALAGDGGDGSSWQSRQADRSAQQERRASRERAAAPAAPGPTPPSAQPGNAPPQAAALNDQGFSLMNARRYDEAVPILQRAVAAFPGGSRDLTYAYALYNLGRSLRLAGRPQEAIPVLERRLRLRNQREVVARELAAARAAAAR